VDISDREELRIGFVSVPRAERCCAIALPDSIAEDVIARYLTMGFEDPTRRIARELGGPAAGRRLKLPPPEWRPTPTQDHP